MCCVVNLEESIDGKYLEDTEFKMPGPFENSEFETDSMSVCTKNQFFSIENFDAKTKILIKICFLEYEVGFNNAKAISNYFRLKISLQ